MLPDIPGDYLILANKDDPYYFVGEIARDVYGFTYLVDSNISEDSVIWFQELPHAKLFAEDLLSR